MGAAAQPWAEFEPWAEFKQKGKTRAAALQIRTSKSAAWLAEHWGLDSRAASVVPELGAGGRHVLGARQKIMSSQCKVL